MMDFRFPSTMSSTGHKSKPSSGLLAWDPAGLRRASCCGPELNSRRVQCPEGSTVCCKEPEGCAQVPGPGQRPPSLERPVPLA